MATPLYIIYALVQGAAFAMADIVHLRVHSFGSIEFLTRTPLAINAGLAMDIVNFIWVTVLFGVIMFFIENFMIKKFDYATPGVMVTMSKVKILHQNLPDQQVLGQAQQVHKLSTSSTFLVDVLTSSTLTHV